MWCKRKASGPSHTDTEVEGHEWRERVGVGLDPCGREWSQCDTAGPREGVGCAQLPRPRTQRVRHICAPQLKHNTPVSDTHLHQHLPLHLTKDDGEATDTSIDDWVPKDAGNNSLTITGTRLAWNEKTVSKDRPNFDAGLKDFTKKTMRLGYEHSSPFHPRAFVGQLQKMSDVPPLPTFGGESDGSDDGSQNVGWLQHNVWNHMLELFTLQGAAQRYSSV